MPFCPLKRRVAAYSAGGLSEASSRRAASALSYWKQRDWRRLLISIPAILAFIGIAVLGTLMARETDDELINWYKKEAQAAQENGDNAKAITLADAANRMKRDNYNTMYLANLSAAHGDKARYKAILESLAPADRKGHPQAHYDLALFLLREGPVTKANAALAEKHLLRIAENESSLSENANAALGQYYMALGEYKQAINVLTKTASQTRPRVSLAVCYAAIDNRELAEIEAPTAAMYSWLSSNKTRTTCKHSG